MWQSMYPARTSCRFLSTSGTAGECQGRVTRGSLPLVRTLSKPHRAGDLHIHPKPRNAHVPQGFPRGGNVAGQASWRNATRPAERFRRGGRRCGSVADTGETCRALSRMASRETLRRCGKIRDGPAWGSRGRARGEGSDVWQGRPFASHGLNLPRWHRGRLNDSWRAAMREHNPTGADDP